MPVDIFNAPSAAEGSLDSHEPQPVAHGMPSLPTSALDNPTPEPEEPRHWYDFLLLAGKIDDVADKLATLIDVEQKLLNDRIKERTFVDLPVQISKSIEYTVDYLERRFLYMYSNAAVTLIINTGGTVLISANAWTKISFPRGTKLTAQGVADNAPAAVTIRACDFYMG